MAGSSQIWIWNVLCAESESRFYEHLIQYWQYWFGRIRPFKLGQVKKKIALHQDVKEFLRHTHAFPWAHLTTNKRNKLYKLLPQNGYSGSDQAKKFPSNRIRIRIYGMSAHQMIVLSSVVDPQS
jgi:hypothetical protein